VLAHGKHSAENGPERVGSYASCESKGILYKIMYFLYLLECSDGSIYTGITTNVERRFEEHKKGIGGHYTSSKQVIKVLYTEEHPDRSSALKREAQIKRWRREKKLQLTKLGK
jgi:putative endonuclease